MGGAWAEDPRGRIGDFLDKIASVGREDTDAVEFRDEEGWGCVEVSRASLSLLCIGAKEVMANRKTSPNGPTSNTKLSQPTTSASLAHHARRCGGPSAPACDVSYSARLRWKSAETTQSVPVAVSRPSDLPFGEGQMWVNGPRSRRCGRHVSAQRR